MSRYFISPIALIDRNGRQVWAPAIVGSLEWAAEIGQGDASLAAVYPPQNPDGSYSLPWCLVVARAREYAALGDIPGVDLLPDFPLDAKVSSMHEPTRAAMRTRLVTLGVDGGSLDNADGFRDVIHAIGRARLGNAGFDADSFTAI